MRLLTAVCALFALTVPAIAFNTTEAAAAPPETCQANAVLPSRAAVQSPTATLQGTALHVTVQNEGMSSLILGHFDLVGPGITLPGGTDDWHAPVQYGYLPPSFPANKLRPGTYTAQGLERDIYTIPEVTCTWTPTSMVIKFGGNAGIGETRTGSVVTISGLFHEYRGTGFTYPVGRTEYLQRYSAGAWHNIASTAVNSRGGAAISFVDSSVGEYRWVSIENPLTFGFTSPIGFR